jgi:hypothetical protein
MEQRVRGLADAVLALLRDVLIPACEDRLPPLLPSTTTTTTTPEGEGEAGPRDEARTHAWVLDSLVFFYKSAADYCRYVAECCSDAPAVSRHSDEALSHYSKARQYATTRMHPASPASLGVTLNFSVFLFEIRRCEEEALELATAALNDANAALDEDDEAEEAEAAGGTAKRRYAPLSEEERGESEAICSLLEGNIQVWSQVLGVSALLV